LEKRLPLALFLSFLILFGWTLLNPPKEPDPATAQDGPTMTSAAGEAAPQITDASTEADSTALGEPAAEPWTQDLLLEPGQGDWDYWARFDNLGGALTELRLSRYVDVPRLSEEERADKEHWTTLLTSIDAGAELPTRSFTWTTGPSSQTLVERPLDRVHWQHEVLREGERTVGVHYWHDPGRGIVFHKTLRVSERPYELEFILELENNGQSSDVPTGIKSFVVTPAACVPRESTDSFYIEPQSIAAWRSDGEFDSDVEERDDRGGPESESFPVRLGTDFAFAGVHNKYFAVLLRAADEMSQATPADAVWRRVYDAEFARENPDQAQAAFRSMATDVYLDLYVPEANKRTSYKYAVFAGPKDRDVLLASYEGHGALVERDLGFFASIARLLLAILGFFEGLTGNWGWAIILLTLTVRTALFPLMRRSQTAMARHQSKMKRIQPRLDEIKKKYENDQAKFRQEQAKIIQEEGAFPPLGGCLPMFLQLPVFIGLFQALRTSFDLRQAPFHGWIEDLSMPDRLLRIDLNTHLPFIGTIEWLNVLPPLMVVLWIVQQRVMPKPTDEQALRMHRMMMWMPIMFGFFLYNYAAGLSLYMITQSVLGIVEQTVIKRIWPLDDRELPKKKSGFMKRLADLQEQAQKMQAEQQRQKARQGGGGANPKKRR